MKKLNFRIFLSRLPFQAILLLGIIAVMGMGDLTRAQTKTDEPSGKTVTPRTRRTPNPQMTTEQIEEMKKAREDFMAQPPACTAGSARGFSVLGSRDFSGVNDTVLQYRKVITNEGSTWLESGSMFIVPCDGLYYMALAFVKDPYESTTLDDVFAYIVVNTPVPPKVVIPGLAWGGEQSTLARSTGAYSVLYRLRAGDIVQTWVYSDGPVNNQPRRLLYQYSFTGFLVAP